MKRRDFILLASAGAAALAIPTAIYSFREKTYDKLLSQPASLFSIMDPDAVNIIGLNYMTKVRRERTERALVKRLMSDAPEKGANMASSLNQKIQQDFINRNTILIDGWILSVTEARQCALFSLTLQKS